MASFPCPFCGAMLKHVPELVGKRKPCPNCHKAFEIPPAGDPLSTACDAIALLPAVPPPADENLGAVFAAGVNSATSGEVRPAFSAWSAWGRVITTFSGALLGLVLVFGLGLPEGPSPIALAVFAGGFQFGLMLIAVGTLREIKLELLALRQEQAEKRNPSSLAP